MFLKRPQRAFKQMRELSEASLAEGTDAEFDAWVEGYRRLIHPRTLAHDGYERRWTLATTPGSGTASGGSPER